jgi:hypothetical protein
MPVRSGQPLTEARAAVGAPRLHYHHNPQVMVSGGANRSVYDGILAAVHKRLSDW